ncbi:S1C family serine protease [Candidatus Hydrogenedentota bacterium]
MTNTDGMFGDKAYMWAVALLLIEITILVYSGIFMSDRLRKTKPLDGSRNLERVLNAFDGDSPTAAQASFILTCEQESYSSAISVVRPSVVYIEVRFSEAETTVAGVPDSFAFDVAKNDSGNRYGSGVIVDREGYILTNYHVVVDAVAIEVTPFSSKTRKYGASVIRISEREDLALIKIDADYNLPEATIGDSDKVEVGDVVVAIGSPFGMEHTATLGIISDDGRSVVIDGRLYNDMLQTDAAINTGNSGGALVNIQGEVIGVNTAIFAPTGSWSGVGFAIPINRAKAMLAEGLFAQPKAAAGI